MVSSMYQLIKGRLGPTKTSAANESIEKEVKTWPVEGYKDIKRLKQFIHEKRDTDGKLVMSSSMKEIMECLISENITLMEILSRTIGRIDKLESKQH